MYHQEKVRHRKLEPYVQEIRRRHGEGEDCAKLAREFGVAKQSVAAVVSGEAYPCEPS